MKTEQLAATIEAILAESQRRFAAFSDEVWEKKPAPGKWSKKEILGHLVDSAQNNLRRLVVTQYQQNDRIVYHQDEWVDYQGYQHAPTNEIVQLWVLLNRQLARTMRNVPEEKLGFVCNTGKTSPELHTLQFLAEDYVKHLRHHLAQMGL